ncbi:MAG: DUF3089 domain-containing protein [Lachnospira sp.]
MKKRIHIFGCMLLVATLMLSGCQKEQVNKYSDMSNWAYAESEELQKLADVFFVCPTVYAGAEDSFNMDMSDEKTKKNFLGAINMEKGIYDEEARFFAPYYKQAGMNVYSLPEEEREVYLNIAYEDVKEAFSYYLKEENKGRPVILAGFSQGADLCIRLMKEYSSDAKVMNKIVACYAIGWSVTQEELDKYPSLKFAEGEADTGVIIAFNSEAEYVDDSLTIPKGTKTLTINPLNWKTDGTLADKSLNKGACFTDYGGNIVKEIPELTGAYIDGERGALKVVDVTAEEYPPRY